MLVSLSIHCGGIGTIINYHQSHHAVKPKFLKSKLQRLNCWILNNQLQTFFTCPPGMMIKENLVAKFAKFILPSLVLIIWFFLFILYQVFDVLNRCWTLKIVWRHWAEMIFCDISILCQTLNIKNMFYHNCPFPTGSKQYSSWVTRNLLYKPLGFLTKHSSNFTQ